VQHDLAGVDGHTGQREAPPVEVLPEFYSTQGEDRGNNGDAQDFIVGEEIEIGAEEDKII
jgi:hypothetical protein